MPRRSGTSHCSPRAGLLFFCLAMLVSGCGSPGEPIERKPPVPQPVTDLAAEQAGNSVILTFELPKEAVDHRPLEHPLTVEIYRDFEPVPDTTTPNPAKPPAPAAHPALHATIPAAVVDNYTDQGRIRYADALQPADFTQHPDSVAVYTVRTRASVKSNSADSNAAVLRIHPAPDPIEDLKAAVTHSGIQITWMPPQKTPVGPAPPIALYRVYRGEAQQATPAVSPAPAATEIPASSASGKEAGNRTPRMLKIGESDTNSYLDTQFEFGKSYVYTVRSVVQYGGDQIESADSNSFVVLARGISPPAIAQGLVVVYVPAQDAVPAHLELSWGISPETDLAGYNVYRSEQPGSQGSRVNSDLLLTPAFRDMNTVPGRTYFYAITAVDRSGNESPPSAAVSGTMQAEGQSTP